MSAECSRRLATKKKKQSSQPTVETKRATEEQEFKSRKHIWRFFTSQVFRVTLHIIVVLYCSLDSY